MPRPPNVPLLVLALLASAIVAITAGGDGLLLDAGAGEGATTAVRVAGLLASMAGLAYLARGRRRLPPTTGRGRDPTAAALGGAALVMGVLALVSALAFGRYDDRRIQFPEPEAAADTLFADQPGEGPPSPRAQRAAQRSLLPIRSPAGAAGGRSRDGATLPTLGEDDAASQQYAAGSMLQAVALAVLALLLLAAIAIAVRILARPMRDEPALADEPEVSLPDAMAALEASLLDVAYDGTDPRMRITVAYHRLLNAMAEAGAQREPQEAPHEFLRRALSPLGLQPEPMHRLAELYVLAQFSRQPLREEHCTAAADALEQSIHSLERTPAGAAMEQP